MRIERKHIQLDENTLINSTMKFTLIVSLFMFGLYDVARGDQRRQQRIVGNVEYAVSGWYPIYSCAFHNPTHYCTWQTRGNTFDPPEHGFHYDKQNTCRIIADNYTITRPKQLECVGYIQYPNNIINATLEQSVELYCQSAVNKTCEWRRNNKGYVYITGDYSYTSIAPRPVNDCSIRIHSVEDSDFGKWTCTYSWENQEIITAYTLNNSPTLSANISMTDAEALSSGCIAPDGRCEQQEIVKSPDNSEFIELHSYTCDIRNPHHCTWLMYGAVFDPIKYLYHYEDTDNNNCNIKANDNAILKLHDSPEDISCAGHINYNNSIIKAGINDSVEFYCHSRDFGTKCGWKLNDVNVSIDDDRYSYLYDQTFSDDCSIRINSVSLMDIGNWTCRELPRNEEILRGFTLLLNEDLQEALFMGISTILVVGAISAVASLFIFILVYIICEKKRLWKWFCSSTETNSVRANVQLPYLLSYKGSLKTLEKREECNRPNVYVIPDPLYQNEPSTAPFKILKKEPHDCMILNPLYDSKSCDATYYSGTSKKHIYEEILVEI